MQQKWSKQKEGYASHEATTSRDPVHETITVHMFAAMKASPAADAMVSSAAATVLGFAS